MCSAVTSLSGWAKRKNGSTFGYKLHVKMDWEQGLVRSLEVTPASVHDSRVELSRPGELVYRDKGYFGAVPRGLDATMRRGVRGHPLSIWGRLRNRRIGSKRRSVERVFAVLKRVFNGGRVLVTRVERVRVVAKEGPVLVVEPYEAPHGGSQSP